MAQLAAAESGDLDVRRHADAELARVARAPTPGLLGAGAVDVGQPERLGEGEVVVAGVVGADSIMNCGPQSILTEADRTDLASLYQMAWSGHLSEINGTPIRFVRPYSAQAEPCTPAVTELAPVAARAAGY